MLVETGDLSGGGRQWGSSKSGVSVDKFWMRQKMKL